MSELEQGASLTSRYSFVSVRIKLDALTRRLARSPGVVLQRPVSVAAAVHTAVCAAVAFLVARGSPARDRQTLPSYSSLLTDSAHTSLFLCSTAAGSLHVALPRTPQAPRGLPHGVVLAVTSASLGGLRELCPFLRQLTSQVPTQLSVSNRTACGYVRRRVRRECCLPLSILHRSWQTSGS